MGTEAVSTCLVFILTAVAAILLLKARVVMITVMVILLEVKQELFIVSWESNLVMPSTRITLISRIKQILQFDPFVSVGLVTNSNTLNMVTVNYFHHRVS